MLKIRLSLKKLLHCIIMFVSFKKKFLHSPWRWNPYISLEPLSQCNGHLIWFCAWTSLSIIKLRCLGIYRHFLCNWTFFRLSNFGCCNFASSYPMYNFLSGLQIWIEKMILQFLASLSVFGHKRTFISLKKSYCLLIAIFFFWFCFCRKFFIVKFNVNLV